MVVSSELRRVAGLVLMVSILARNFPSGLCQDVDGCFGFDTIYPLSGTDQMPVLFSWRTGSDMRQATVEGPPGGSFFIFPDETGLYSYNFPIGTSTVRFEEGCSFTVINTVPCNLDPCPLGSFCLETETKYACQSIGGGGITGFFFPCDRDFYTGSFVSEGPKELILQAPGNVSMVRVKYPGESFQKAAILGSQDGDTEYSYTFRLGIARVYLYGPVEILLCSFDIVLSNPCLEKPCADGFRCSVIDDEPLYICTCLADISDELCSVSDLSQCNDELCNFDVHECVDPGNDGVYECSCKPGLPPTADPDGCLAAYVGFTSTTFSGIEGGSVAPVIGLSVGLPVDVTVHFAISSTPPTDVADYTSPQQYTFIASTVLGGQAVGVTITLIEDDLIETEEALTIEIVDVSFPAVVRDDMRTATVIIVDNDIGTVCLPTSTITVQEVDGQVIVPVTISGPPQNDLVVVLQKVDVTALSGDDYGGPQIEEVSIPALEQGTTLIIPIVQDLVTEESETFEVIIQAVNSPGIPDLTCTATVMIIDEFPDNPCIEGTDNCDEVSTLCVPGIGNEFTCECRLGYMSSTALTFCTDIDECLKGVCDSASTTCRNTMGSFICDCRGGFIPDTDFTCREIDECSSSPCQFGGTCIDGISSYLCECADGYDGTNCEEAMDDGIPPSASCPDDVVVIADRQTGLASVTFTEPTATDNSGQVELISRTHSPGDDFEVGFTMVTYTFSDPSMNTASCTFIVSVFPADQNPPAVSPCDDYVIEVPPGDMGTAVDFTEPSATDESGVAELISRSHSPGDFFSVGSTTVTYQFGDRYQNVATCRFVIVVAIAEVPEVSIVQSLSVREGDVAGIRVSLAAPTNGDITAVLEFEEVTASRNDYQTLSSSVLIPENEVSADLAISIVDDPSLEIDETLLVRLVGVMGHAVLSDTSTTATITLVDNDSTVISISPARTPIEEGEVVRYNVQSTTSLESIDLHLFITPNVGDPETYILPAGNTRGSVTFSTVNDNVNTGTRTFRIDVHIFLVCSGLVLCEDAALPVASDRITIDGGNLAVTILDSDPSCSEITSTEVGEDAGVARMFIVIPRSFDTEITVSLSVIDGSARVNEDYESIPATVTILPGFRFTSLNIGIINDLFEERDEEFSVVITDVTFPGSYCESSSTATVIIHANDEGPVVDYCPRDIVVYSAPSTTQAYARWEPARFSVDDVPVDTVVSPDSETTVDVGSSRQIMYTATDEAGRESRCTFTVSAVEITDFKTYAVSIEITPIEGIQDGDSTIEEGLRGILQKGECWRDFAGMEVVNISPSSTERKYDVFYKLFFTPISRCCIRDILIDANDQFHQLGNSLGNKIFLSTNTHLPDFITEYHTSITFETDASSVSASVYEDPKGQPAQSLQLELLKQISDGLDDLDEFKGVCVPLPFTIGSVTANIRIESNLDQDVDSLDIFLHGIQDLFQEGLSLPDGFEYPDPATIRLEGNCPAGECSGNGRCITGSLVDLEPDCICDDGWILGNREDCSQIDPNYCPEVSYVVNDIHTNVTSVILLMSRIGKLDPGRLVPDPCRETRGDDFLNIIDITCVRDSSAPADWVILLNCNATLEEFLRYLQGLEIGADNVMEISDQLANATHLFDGSGSMEALSQTANLVNDIVNTNSTSGEVTSNVTVTISNVLSADDDILEESYQNGTTAVLLEAFERQLQQVDVTNGSYNQNSNNIVVMVLERDSDMLDGFGIATMTPVGNISAENNPGVFEDVMVIDTRTEDVSQVRSKASSLLLYPPELSRTIAGADANARVTYAVYRRPNLFSSRYYTTVNSEQGTFQRRVKRRFVPNTRVISSSLYMNNEAVLTWDREPGMFDLFDSTFQQWYLPLQDPSVRSVLDTSLCSFWNFRADGGRGNWSTNGCRFVAIDENGLINCECTHLTNFAVLMDVFDGDSLTEVQLRILDIATLFGCGASILGLLLTLVAFISHDKLRRTKPNQILILLCITLTGLYVAFLFMVLLDSERQRAFLSDVSCNIMAGVMQFFVLSSVAWMTVESVNMYFLFVKVINAHVSGFIWKAVLFAEGVPLVIVGLTYGISTWAGGPGTYTREDVCFVSAPWPILGGVAVPIFMCMVFNTVMYFRVIWRLNKRVPGKKVENKNEKQKQFQNAVAILLLMGITWATGYFCFIPAGQVPLFVFQLLFVLLNSMQGYLIFMLYCMRNPTFRKRWRQWCFICPDRPLTTLISSKYSLPSDSVSRNRKKKPNHSPGFLPYNVPVSAVERTRISADIIE